ncbi:MAG TPA: porin [Anaeromyxobacter sp.]
MRLTATIFAVLFAFQSNAQENKLSISGRAWASLENVSVTDATAAANVLPRYRVTNDASWIRVRGDLKLSDTLTAWGQIESQFAIDGGAATPFDSGRNTGVGFTSKVFGTIFLGRWDSPMKISTIRLDPWGNSTIMNYAATVGTGPNTGGNLFDARLANGVQYWTPVVSGLQLRAAAMVNEDRTSTGAQQDPSVLSFSATYDGPLYLAVSYETRKDCSAANGQAAQICTPGGSLLGAHGRDWSLRAGAGINLKPTHTELGVVFDRIYDFADVGATTRSQGRNSFYGSLVQGLGGDAHQIVVAGGIALKLSGNTLPAGPARDRTGAVWYTAAYRYNFNKDLFVYGGYVRIMNDANAAYRFGSAGLAGAATNPTGGTYNGWSIGTRYLF